MRVPVVDWKRQSPLPSWLQRCRLLRFQGIVRVSLDEEGILSAAVLEVGDVPPVTYHLELSGAIRDLVAKLAGRPVEVHCRFTRRKHGTGDSGWLRVYRCRAVE
ncbi:hypothetical protein ACFL59_02795 [Planctomycetota bacterium]